jgi:hypothetical protein
VDTTPSTETNTEAVAQSAAGPRRRRLSVVEVVAIVIVLGVLAVFVGFTVSDANQKAITATCAAEAKAIRTAVDAYRAKHGATTRPQMTGPNSLLSDHDVLAPSPRWIISYLGNNLFLTAIPGAGCRGSA